jgi:protein involved in polysaccharide export with SLBB domain
MRWISAAVLAASAACAAPQSARYEFVMPRPEVAAHPGPTDTTSRVVYVTGEVNAPGRVRFHDGLTLVGALVDSGGLTALAARRVIVTRTAGGTRTSLFVSIDAIVDGREQDLPLAEGDQLFVEGRYI